MTMETRKQTSARLTPREKQIAALLLRGDKREAMASALGVSVRTVDNHLSGLKGKLCAYCLVTLAVKLARVRQ